jgi:hypothetical protein
MRRGLSLFLILVFGLGPLAATIPSSEGLRLPPCCRRHGAHRCAVSMRLAALDAQAARGGRRIFTAPAHCPLYPDAPAAPVAQALSTAAVSLPALLAQAHSPEAGRASAVPSRMRLRAGRGPPSALPG